MIVIARLLGIAPEDYRRFRAWSDAVIASDAPAEATSSAVREMHALFREVAASRRGAPRDDLISVLVHADAGGEPLSEEELLDICQVMLVSGNQTTTALISNLLNVLVDRPDLWARLREDRALGWTRRSRRACASTARCSCSGGAPCGMSRCAASRSPRAPRWP